MKYKSLDDYRTAHPDCAALLESEHGFDFLTNMRTAIESGKNITENMQAAIERCLTSRMATDPDEALREAGVEEPVKGEVVEALRVSVYKVEVKLERDGLGWLIFHWRDQHGRPGRGKTRDEDLRDYVFVSSGGPDLLPDTSAGEDADTLLSSNVNVVIHGSAVWTRGFFAIWEIEGWSPPPVISHKAASQMRRNKDGGKRKAPETPPEVAKVRRGSVELAVPDTAGWLGDL